MARKTQNPRPKRGGLAKVATCNELLGDELYHGERVVGDEVSAKAQCREGVVDGRQYEERPVLHAGVPASTAQLHRFAARAFTNVPEPPGAPLALHARWWLEQPDVHARDECVEDGRGQFSDAGGYRTHAFAVQYGNFPVAAGGVGADDACQVDLGPAMGVDDHVVCFGVAGDGGRGKK